MKDPMDYFAPRPPISDPGLKVILLPEGPGMFKWENDSFVFTEVYRLDTGERLHRSATIKRRG